MNRILKWYLLLNIANTNNLNVKKYLSKQKSVPRPNILMKRLTRFYTLTVKCCSSMFYPNLLNTLKLNFCLYHFNTKNALRSLKLLV